jgi:hypothetical protein
VRKPLLRAWLLVGRRRSKCGRAGDPSVWSSRAGLELMIIQVHNRCHRVINHFFCWSIRPINIIV